jgi:dihydrofolate reductase
MTHKAPDKPEIALVVAAARNHVIGLGGKMPWRVPSDLKVFRELTMGNPIIMGRKTFESIGGALDGRTNIVVTRDTAYQADGALIAASLQDALSLATKAPSADNRIMIIGGGEIYRLALPLADIVYLTEIDAEPDGDTWFPALDPGQWAEMERKDITPGPHDQYRARLITFHRRPD